MYTTRQNKISRLIQKELSEIFQKEMSGIFGNMLVTVTVVRVSPDLAVAKVYLSIYSTQGTEGVLDSLKTNIKQIRNFLGQRIRHQVKKIPELIFYKDDSLDYIDRIDELLKK